MSSLGVRLLAVVVLPPILVAVVLVFGAARLFQQDKELYSFDLATQTVDLLARNLHTTVASLQRRVSRLEQAEPPFLQIGRPVTPARGDPIVQLVKGAAGKKERLLSLRYPSAAGAKLAILPAAKLIDLARQGPARLLVVNVDGEIMAETLGTRAAAPASAAHTTSATRTNRQRRAKRLLARLSLFARAAPRLGSKEVTLEGQTMLVAFARIKGGLAVLQTIPKEQVSAAAAPMIRTAAAISGATVLVALLLALLLSRRIVAPLRAMAKQAEAIGRGDFDSALQHGPAAAGEVASLADSLRNMSASLKQREQDLERVQQRLLQSERLNATMRAISAISAEIAQPLEAGQLAAEEARRALDPLSDSAAWLESLVTSLDKAANMVKKLRRLDAPGSGDIVEIEVGLPIAEVLVSARPMLAQREIEVSLDTMAAAAPIRVNSRNLESALLDVLYFVGSRAREESEAHVLVSNHALPDGRAGVVIAVRYRGPTLDEAERKQLLSPIDAVEHESTLVLAVAAMAISEEGGFLTIEPTATGNMIQIRLPAVGSAETLQPPSGSVGLGKGDITAPTLPVIDDDIDIELV